MSAVIIAIITAIGFLGVIATAWVIVRSNVITQNAKLWEGEAIAEKARGDRLQRELNETTLKYETAMKQVEVISDLKTGSTAIAKLGDEIAKSNELKVELLHDIKDGLLGNHEILQIIQARLMGTNASS